MLDSFNKLKIQGSIKALNISVPDKTWWDTGKVTTVTDCWEKMAAEEGCKEQWKT